MFSLSRDSNASTTCQADKTSALTRTVATLFGNIFAVMAKEEVMAAAKPKASRDLTIKHRVMKVAPAGARSSNLRRNKGANIRCGKNNQKFK